WRGGLGDVGGGGFRLFALDADERRLVLLIIEEDVENAVGQERNADHRDEQRDVFGEQAPAGLCNGGFGRRLLRRVRTCVLTRVFSTHEWITCGPPVPPQRFRPDDQIRSVWCRTPRPPWQSPSRPRPPAHVWTKR